jgi:hypothetical protein
MKTSRNVHGSGWNILSSDSSQSIPSRLDLYLITSSKRRTLLFSPTEMIEAIEAKSDDRIHRFTMWLSRSQWRIVAWLGRVFQGGHAYYVKLEAKLAPTERVLKAIASATHFTVYHSSTTGDAAARRDFQTKLGRERAKHLFWFVIDLTISGASLVLAFIPGPNVVGYYPFLRSLSHYRAFIGSFRGLRSKEVDFKYLPELGALEENLRAPTFDRRNVQQIIGDLRLSGLEQFLEKMG